MHMPATTSDAAPASNIDRTNGNVGTSGTPAVRLTHRAKKPSTLSTPAATNVTWTETVPLNQVTKVPFTNLTFHSHKFIIPLTHLVLVYSV